MTVASAVISIVPSIAGHIPPMPAGSTLGGIGLPVRNCQLMIEAPLAITVNRTNPSGMITSTNETTIRTVMIRFLVLRQPFGSRRSGACPGMAAVVIRPPSSAARIAPRSRGPGR